MTLEMDVDTEPDEDATLDLSAAAEYLGVSPTALAHLLDSGALDSVPTKDVWRRRVRLTDLEARRSQHFALRQHVAAQTRARRLSVPGPDLVSR